MKMMTGTMLALLLLGVNQVGAQNVIRLGDVGQAPAPAASNLKFDGSAQTQDIGFCCRRRYCGCYGGYGYGGYGYSGYGYGYGYGYGGYPGSGYGGGYPGYGYGGGYPGYGYGGGYPGYGYGGGYPGYGYGGGYPGYGYGGGYPGYGYGGGYPGYGYGGGYSGYGYSGYSSYSGYTSYPGYGYGYGYPISVDVTRQPAATVNLNCTGSIPPQAPPATAYPYNQAPPSTFPYNGGPQSPVPMPAPQAAPGGDQQRTIPRDGYTVSLPRQTTGAVSSHGLQVPARTQQPAAAPKYVYRAYGE